MIKRINIGNAISAFKKLDDNNYKEHSKFFGKYGVGNTTGETIDHPFERFQEYEKLLIILKNEDERKYEKIHKGTPFFFLGWIAFDLKNYETAVFYLDAAISENIKFNIDWLKFPSGKFLALESKGKHPWKRINDILSTKISDELNRFSKVSGLSISKEDFREQFIKILLQTNENHSIITAFYSYILEFEEREKELSLKSSRGGSMEPVLTYLFKGGLIFESLLKNKYKKSDSSNFSTLKKIFSDNNFKNDFFSGVQTSARTLSEIINGISDNTLETAFNTCSKLRNTSGHNLVWNDIDDINPKNFRKLFEQQVNAIFYLIHKKF